MMAVHPSVKTCECGHQQVEHASGKQSYPHELTSGICLAYGCPCLRFAEQVEMEKAA